MSNKKHTTRSSRPSADTSRNPQRDLSDLANRPHAGLLHELASMIAHNKKWWLVPILVMLLVLGLIVFLGGTAAAPFIYTLF
jgi:hypothetical protein